MEGVVVVIPYFVVLMFIVTSLLYWLWNTTMTEVFDLRKITFWQAFRLLVFVVLVSFIIAAPIKIVMT